MKYYVVLEIEAKDLQAARNIADELGNGVGFPTNHLELFHLYSQETEEPDGILFSV